MAVDVCQLPFLTRLGIRVCVLAYRLVILTLRVQISPRGRVFLDSKPTSCLFLTWHNRGPLALAGFARYGKKIPLMGLVSASNDGSLMAEVMKRFGMPSARGSSSRRAVEAIRELLTALSMGRNVVITPDGPRGPIYTVKNGTVDFGRGHAAAIYILGFNCNNVWTFNSWDKYMIPKPFSRLDFDVEKIDTSLDYTSAVLQEKLMLLNHS